MIKYIIKLFESKWIYQYLSLVMIVLIACALRFYKLGEWSFWIEEHHSLRHTFEIISSKSIASYSHPLFFLLLKPVFMFLGVNEWTARLIPAIIGIVSIPFLYWVTKKLFFSLPIALLAAFLLAISPWHLYWSQNARFYILFLLLYNISFFAFYWGLEKDRFRYIITSVIFLALAGATHPLAILLIPIFVAYFFLLKLLPFDKPPGLRLRNIIPLIILPLIGYLFYEILRIVVGDIPFAYQLYLKFFNEETASYIGYANPYVMLTAVVYYVGAPMALLTAYGSFYLLKKKSRIGLFLTLGAFTPLGTMMVLTLFASTSNRYVFISLLCWIMLGAVALKALYLQAKERKIFLLAGTLLVTLLLLLRDPVIEDVLYYMGTREYLGLFLALGVLACLFGILLLSRLTYNAKYKTVPIWGFGVFLIVLVHPILTDIMYYTYQHGHRDNWKVASITIQKEKFDKDIIVSSIPPLATYYLDEEVEYIKSIDLDAIMQDGSRVWFIEDYGMDVLMGKTFEHWAAKNCDLVNNWDQYTAGRNWKMRLHLCDPNLHHQASK